MIALASRLWPVGFGQVSHSFTVYIAAISIMQTITHVYLLYAWHLYFCHQFASIYSDSVLFCIYYTILHRTKHTSVFKLQAGTYLINAKFAMLLTKYLTNITQINTSYISQTFSSLKQYLQPLLADFVGIYFISHIHT